MTFKALIVLSLLLGGILAASIGGTLAPSAEAGPSCTACD
jgi:hypothetical protein